MYNLFCQSLQVFYARHINILNKGLTKVFGKCILLANWRIYGR